MSELPIEDAPAFAKAAREAAGGKVVHITEHGQRLAAIVPESMIGALHAAEDAEEADAAWDEPGGSVPLEQLENEFGR